MDQTQLQQKIAEYYSRLPQDAQEVFSSMGWMDTLKNIAIKYKLNDSQIESLGTETTLVLLGAISLNEYIETLDSDLKIPDADFEKLIGEIDSSIFTTITPSLDEAYKESVKILVDEKYGSIQKLDERFSKLPKEVQTAITESNYQAELYNIGSEYKLNIEQMGNLEQVTNNVLLGITHPDQYESELKSKISIPSDQIIKLVSSVNEKVLKNIREILKSHWASSDVADTSDDVPTPPYAEKIVLDEKAPSPVYAVPEAPKVEVMAPKPLSYMETGVYKTSGIEVVNDAKDDIGDSFIGSKLSKPTISTPVVSDHSLPKMAPSQPASQSSSDSKTHDPYHEPIE